MTLGIETPSLEQVIKSGIEARITEMHTCMPGIVESYDDVLQLADVQPSFKRVFVSGKSVELPVITNVPVKWPRAGGTMIHMPLKKGDVVTLGFAERSLDNWLAKGGVVDPEDPRKFQLSDAYAYPGGYPFSDPVIVIDPKALAMICGFGVKLKLMRDGDADEPFVLGNVLTSLFSDMLSYIIAHTHLDSLTGPTTPPLNAASFAALKISPVLDGELLSDFIMGAKT